MSDEEFVDVRWRMPLRVWGRLASAADIEQRLVKDIVMDAISARLDRHSVPPRPNQVPAPTSTAPAAPADLADESVRTHIRELHDLSWSGPEIARHLGVSYDRTLAVLHELGLVAPRKPKGNVDVVLLRELHSQHLSDAKIAAVMNVTSEAVRVKRNALKLPPAAKTGRPKTKTQPEPTKENHHS